MKAGSPDPPEVRNPLLAGGPDEWGRLVEAVDPASLLLVMERRMNVALRREMAPEDILQEALLHAWRDRRSFEWRGFRGFRSWLLSIIDHRISHAVERQGTAKRTAPGPVGLLSADTGGEDGSSAGPDDPPAGSTTPSKVAMYRERMEILSRALDSLPEEFREIVRLRMFEQVLLEDIARSLGLGVSAVRHRFRKGSGIFVRRVRALLGSRPPGEAPDSSADVTADPSPVLRDPAGH